MSCTIDTDDKTDFAITHVQGEDFKPTREPVDPKPVIEIGGRKGPEPTRYGDWEQNGRCSDF